MSTPIFLKKCLYIAADKLIPFQIMPHLRKYFLKIFFLCVNTITKYDEVLF